MKDTDVIENLQHKLRVLPGRHLYGVLGSYAGLKRFSQTLQQARTLDGQSFPTPLSVTRGILDNIPDAEFRDLVEKEAKRPEPIGAHIKQAFEKFLRFQLHDNGLIILEHLEILFAYQCDLGSLRVLATDEHHVLLLLPGKRENGMIMLFPEQEDTIYTLPTNLIAENHLWELQD
jgi:hypothetical protein